MTKKSAALPNLETSLAEIAELIEKMEHTELTLDQSLHHFERGITLIKHCQKVLTTAEQKVQLLMQQEGKEQLTDYDEEKSDPNE